MSNQAIAKIDMSAFGPPPAIMQQALAIIDPKGSEFSAGVTGGFAVVSIRGKIWRIKHQGNETPLMRNASEPMTSIEAIIVRGSAAISKVYYEGAYAPDADAPPDCSSSNGIVPLDTSPKKQSATCAACPKNAWGSKITDQGKKAKACADSRRLAVVPLGDIDNEVFGGPMLLRIPPASLGELAAFDTQMRNMGYPLFGIGVRIAFDINSEYQKLLYTPIRVLTEAEFLKVQELRNDPRVERILEAEDAPLPGPAAAPAPVFEQAPPTPAPTPAPAPVAAAPKAPPKPKPAAAPAPVAATGFGGAPAPAPQPAPASAPAAGSGFGGFAAAPAPSAAPKPVAPAPVVATAAPQDLDSLLDDLFPSDG
jgi:hypothetical protein